MTLIYYEDNDDDENLKKQHQESFHQIKVDEENLKYSIEVEDKYDYEQNNYEIINSSCYITRYELAQLMSIVISTSSSSSRTNCCKCCCKCEKKRKNEDNDLTVNENDNLNSKHDNSTINNSSIIRSSSIIDYFFNKISIYYNQIKLKF